MGAEFVCTRHTSLCSKAYSEKRASYRNAQENNMKVSARNIFTGTIGAITEGAVNAEVDLETAGGDRLVAVVTKDSVAALGLQVGGPVMALVKAPWVMVMVDCGEVQFSARNRLSGVVESVQTGVVNADVGIRLPGGTVVYAVITKEAMMELGLKPGVSATALIKASHVVLARPS
jgi:molybdate transport system regulatory protein